MFILGNPGQFNKADCQRLNPNLTVRRIFLTHSQIH